MARQIVVLNGSPQKDGAIASLVKAFSDGASTSGAEVHEFFLEGMNIHTCNGCFKGNSKNARPCTIQDDMDKIYPLVKSAEVIVLASPVYWWNISGQLKTALDRLVALEEGTDLLHGNHSAVLLMAADGDESQFETVLPWYTHFLSKLGWKNIGHITATGNEQEGNMQHEAELERANGIGQRAAAGII